jgi:hypothetical protein
MGITQQIGASSITKPGVCTSSTRPSSPYAGQAVYETDTNRYIVYNGSGWVSLSGTSTLVTSLPSSPIDGQIIDYVADSANGVVWRFRYRSASASAYKWEFIGGGQLDSYVTAQQSTSAVGATVGLGGPAVTVPFAGDYLVTGGAICATNGAGNLVGFIFKGTGDSDVAWSSTYIYNTVALSNVYGSSASGIQKKINQSAGQSIEMRYAISNAGAIAYFNNRFMTVTPIRVG